MRILRLWQLCVLALLVASCEKGKPNEQSTSTLCLTPSGPAWSTLMDSDLVAEKLPHWPLQNVHGCGRGFLGYTSVFRFESVPEMSTHHWPGRTLAAEQARGSLSWAFKALPNLAEDPSDFSLVGATEVLSEKQNVDKFYLFRASNQETYVLIVEHAG